MHTLIRRRVQRSLFVNVPVQILKLTLFTRHSDVTAAINNRYLDFVQTPGSISLVNDNHVDNNIKEMLVYASFSSIVNNRSKTFITYRYNVSYIDTKGIQKKGN